MVSMPIIADLAKNSTVTEPKCNCFLISQMLVITTIIYIYNEWLALASITSTSEEAEANGHQIVLTGTHIKIKFCQ